jgi:hypothetical protein
MVEEPADELDVTVGDVEVAGASESLELIFRMRAEVSAFGK